MHQEGKFSNWFYNNAPKKFKEIQREVSLFSAYSTLEYQTFLDIGRGQEFNEKQWGRIDFAFIYGSTEYVAEVKYFSTPSSEFWDALKVLGYCAYYNWQNSRQAKPAIMIPADSLHLEHFITSLKLHLTIFAISKNDKGFNVEKVDDTEKYILKNTFNKKKNKIQYGQKYFNKKKKNRL